MFSKYLNTEKFTLFTLIHTFIDCPNDELITEIRALYEEKSEKMKGFKQLEWMEREEARLKRIEAKNKRQNEKEARLKRIVDYNVSNLHKLHQKILYE